MGDRWQYTGAGTPRSYGDYVDAATGRQLLAAPGEEYEIRATWAALPVPPGDGWWKPAAGNTTPSAGQGGDAETAAAAPAGAAPAGKAKT